MLRSMQGKKIVVAEDDASIRELICVRLDLAGYQAIGAKNGYEALSRLSGTKPAALVLDIGMPKLDGFSVLSEVRRRYPRLPVLILTARRANEDVTKAIGMGADAYLVKPFDHKQLLDRIALIIEPSPTQKSKIDTAQSDWEIG